MAYIKERATEKELPKAPWEAAIVKRLTVEKDFKIEDEVLEAAKGARALMAMVTKGMDLATLAGHVSEQVDSFIEQDDTWILDDRQLGCIMRDGGMKIMEVALLATIPADAGPLWSIGEAIEKVEHLQLSALASICPQAATKATTLADVMNNLRKGNQPDEDEWKDSSCMADAPTLTPKSWM